MAAHAHPKALIFAPPLIGGGAAHQIRLFRPLIRSGFDLISFSYAGHGSSEGCFSMGASIRDTRDALGHASAEARRRGIPLLGLATSYSAIPLLKTGRTLRHPFSRLVLINPLTRLRPLAILHSFWGFCRCQPREAAWGPSSPGRLQRYLDSLFPGVGKGPHRFGALSRRRTRLFRILAELMLLNPLSGVTLADTPVLCLYGQRDDVLRIFHPDMRRDYEPSIRSVCPRARFEVFQGGHFLRSAKLRSVVVQSILTYFQRSESEA